MQSCHWAYPTKQNRQLPASVRLSLYVAVVTLQVMASSSRVAAQFDFPGLFGGGGVGASVSAPRSSDVDTWSDSEILQAVEERDARVLEAIELRASATVGDSEFPVLMVSVLGKNSGVMSPVPGQPGPPGIPGFPSGVKPPRNGEQLTPPGGAQLQPARPTIPAQQGRAVTAVEALVGEALLGYLPQDGQSMFTPPAIDGSMPPPGMDPFSNAPPGMDPFMDAPPGVHPPMKDQPPTVVAKPLEDEDLLRTVVKALITNATELASTVLTEMADGKIVSAVPSPRCDEILLAIVCSAAPANDDAIAEIVSNLTQRAVTDYADTQAMVSIASLAAVSTQTVMKLTPPTPAATDKPKTPATSAASRQREMQAQMAALEASQFELPGPDGFAGGAFPGPGPMPTTAAVPATPQSTAKAMTVKTFAAAKTAAPTVTGAFLSNSTVEAVNSQLATDSPDIEMLALATSIPSDEVRHAVFGLFSRRHGQGASSMTRKGLFSSFARDPGILPVLKALPRRRPGRSNESSAADSGASWTQASFQAVTALRDRLRRVDSDPRLAFTGRQPVALHDRKTAPAASIAIVLPASDNESQLDNQPDPTTIHYTRLIVYPQRPAEMQAIIDHYEKRATAFKRTMEAERIVWYDGAKKNTDGTRSSLDVLVQEGAYQSPNGGAAPAAVPGGQPYTIEIIVVTTRDPKEPFAAITTAAN